MYMINLTKTSNPVMSEKAFVRRRTANSVSEVMTINGTVNKTALMLLLVVAAALFTWNKFFGVPNPETAMSAVVPYCLLEASGD
jgi:uncharacterized YccA/Bax inhibitor family protein